MVVGGVPGPERGNRCPERRESSVPSWRGHIVPEKGDKDQDTPPLIPRVLAGTLGMDAVLHRPKLAEKALLRYNAVKSSTA